MPGMRLFFFFLFLGSVAYGQDAGVRLWALSDGVRVSPTSGRLLENRSDIHKDYPSGNPRTGNAVWDAARKTVSLKAARNEFVAFQMIVEVDGPQDEIDVECAGLAGPGGCRLDGRHVALFKEWYTQVRRPSTGYERTSLGPEWYPDALMPYRKARLNSGFPFSIPDLYNNIPNQKNHAIWIDVFVPYERSVAPPGRYAGTVNVSWKGGKDSVSVVVDVWDFALPQENHLPGDIWNGSMKSMPPEEELLYYQLAHQHRFLPLIYAYRPDLKVTGTTVAIDWREYDRRLSRYLDGTAFTDEAWLLGARLSACRWITSCSRSTLRRNTGLRGPQTCRRRGEPPNTKQSGRKPAGRSGLTWTPIRGGEK